MDNSPDWHEPQEVGIGIRRNATPSPELFHHGQPAVIYDTARGTIPAHGEFTSDVFPLEPEKHGCHLAVNFRARAAIPRSEDAPRLQDILPGFDVRQKSYRRLAREEYEALVRAIEGAPQVRRYP